MSKSLGNFRTIKDLLKEYKPEVIRYFVISNHYRQPLDFSLEILKNSENSYSRLKNICETIEDDKKTNKKYLEEFEKEMDDDLNTPNALQVLWNLVRDKNAEGKYKTIEKIDKVFGLKLLEKEKLKIPQKVKKLVTERNKARKNKDWKKADELRIKINKAGYAVDDTKRGVLLRGFRR